MPDPARLILASASPRRRELLARLGIPFTVMAAAVDEHEDPDTDPRRLVEHNAALKAEWVAERKPDAFVLAADTTVWCEGAGLGKPADLAEARNMLRRLSGRTHAVYTGLALRRRTSGLHLETTVESKVVFRKLDESTIDTYLARIDPLDKAGGYAIQEHGDLIVADRSGSLTNIIGLPIEATKQILTNAGLLR